MTQPGPQGVPERFKHYRLVRQLGQGGMGSVFEGVDERINERVAVKVLHPHLAAADPSFAERFEREAHTAALLRSPYTVHLLDFGQQDGRYFMVMEFIEGQSLADVLRQEGRMEPGRALWIAGEVARALEEAGARGIVHRDIKPDNILFDADGRVKVADFGIARSMMSGGLTMAGGFVGTPAYASPEQADGNSDPRSDIYSVGIMLFAMLAGQPPFSGSNPIELMMHHASSNLPMELIESAPVAAQNVVRRACEKDPLDRYQSAAELAGAIDRARQGLQRQSSGGTAMRPAAGGRTQAPPSPSTPPTVAPTPSVDLPTAVASTGARPYAPASAPPAAQHQPAPPSSPPAAPAAGRPAGNNRLLMIGGIGVAAAVVVGAGLFFALAGGGDDDNGATASPSPSASPVIQTATKFELTAVEFQFDRVLLAAPPNTDVTFTLVNEGQARHSLQFKNKEGGSELAPGSTGEVIGGGESTTFSFKTPGPGAYRFECVNHPTRMNGVFEVRADSATAGGSPSPSVTSPATATRTAPATPTTQAPTPTDTPLPSVTAAAASATLTSGAKARPIRQVDLFEAPSGTARVLRPLGADDRVIVVTNTPENSTVRITEGLVFWRVVIEGTQIVGWVPEVTVDGTIRFLERVP